MTEKHSGRYPWKSTWIDKLRYWFRWLRTINIFRTKFTAIIQKTDKNSKLLDLSDQDRHWYDFEDAICWKIVDEVIATDNGKEINVLAFCYYGSVWAYLKIKRVFGCENICVIRTWNKRRCWIDVLDQ